MQKRNDQTLSVAALRVANAYEMGIAPQCQDLWTIQLSVAASDAKDLLLGFDALAHLILERQSSASQMLPTEMPVRTSTTVPR